MQQGSKIYIVGHTGLVGSAIRRRLEALGYGQLVLRTHSDLDLTRQQAVEEFFGWERLDYVFLAPANVEGPIANNPCPADLLYRNLAIESNIISGAYQAGVKRLLFLDSSCVYPYLIAQPGHEEGPLSGQLESANRARAIVKIAGMEMCNAYNRQHGCRFLAVTPPNLYGCGDTYDAHNSRTVPAMLLNMHRAKVNGEREVVLWGSGDPRREFLYSDDLADVCIFLMGLHDRDFDFLVSSRSGPLINIGGEGDLTVRELAELVAEVVMFRGKLRFDVNKPDGIPGKRFDVARTAIVRSRPQMNIKEGLQWTYNDFLSQTRATKENHFREYPRRTVRDRKQLYVASSTNHGDGDSNCFEAASFSWCFDAPIHE
jgi:GDP-L-fucose synthase